MNDNFEARKNMQAGTITAVILGLILLFLLLVGWEIPVQSPPPVEEGLEVNLGNNDKGMGNDQPFEPGKPAPQDQERYTAPKPVVAEKEAVKDVQTNEKDPDAPEIKKPLIAKPEATKIAEKETVKKTPKKLMPVADPVPAPAHPKAVFKGVNGTGTGGNEADSYKKGGNQGIAGGKGDQGQPGGNPNSDNYKGGGHGNKNIQIMRGDREVERAVDLKADFSENGSLTGEVRVDENGNGTFLRATGGALMQKQYTDFVSEKLRTGQIKFKAKKGDQSVISVRFEFMTNN